MMQAKDPLTGELFNKRRNNQKFANRQNQVRYNNIKAQKKRDAKLPIERILDKNRSILQKVLSGRLEITKSKDFLLGMGFNFRYSSYQKEINGVTYSGIYEFGITKTVNDNFKIIKF